MSINNKVLTKPNDCELTAKRGSFALSFFLMSWETIDGLYQLKVDVGVLNTMKI